MQNVVKRLHEDMEMDKLKMRKALSMIGDGEYDDNEKMKGLDKWKNT